MPTSLDLQELGFSLAGPARPVLHVLSVLREGSHRSLQIPSAERREAFPYDVEILLLGHDEAAFTVDRVKEILAEEEYPVAAVS